VLLVLVEGDVPEVLVLDVEGDVADVLPDCDRVAEPLRVADEVLAELPVALLPLVVLPDVWA